MGKLSDYDYILDDGEELSSDQLKNMLAHKISISLSPQQYQVAVMYGDGLSISEIAEHLNLAKGTVGSVMNVARNKIAKMNFPEVQKLYGCGDCRNPFHHEVRKPITEKERLVLEKYPECLSGKQYTLFSLYAKGLKRKEIAEIAGVNAKDLGSRISKIRKKIATMDISA